MSRKADGARHAPAIDVLACEACGGRIALFAMVTDAKSVERYLAKVGEHTDVYMAAKIRGNVARPLTPLAVVAIRGCRAFGMRSRVGVR